MLDPLSTNALQTRHAVTAIIVAHDGARFLPTLVQALKAQTYPIEQTVGVDTASRDRSGAILGELIGEDAVFGMTRSTGYGAAVATALRHAARLRATAGGLDPRRVEWIWLLHDDCEPAPDALEKLLRAAGRDRTVAVVGPKVLDGQDRRTLREVGVAIDRTGRRVTGIDPGEIDQGQHDHKRAVLAVGSAGMLVRRDVWDHLGGFDPNLKLFRDDVDFCWRVQGAGFRVQVATDAILYHWELALRRRRAPDFGSARVLDRSNALYVLAVNLPILAMLRIVGGAVLGSLVRAFYFLLTKQLDLSAAYAFSVLGLFAHPIRLFKGRRRRARGFAEGYSAVRMFIPPARTLEKVAEQIAGLIGNGPPQASSGRHQASVEESEEDAQFVDQVSVVRRIVGHPGVQLFVALLIIALIATRHLLGTSPLGGGALVPTWGGASALWQEYLAGFHAVSVGSTASAPPYLAVVGALATVLGGQAWLAVDVLLLGCVPLAGITAYVATRWVATATLARVLLAASYALLPVATGAVAAGRLGTAVAFILLPLIAVSGGRMVTAPPRQAHRAAWATGLLVGLAAAFAPLTWVLGVVFALGTLGARRWLATVNPLNAAIVIVTPFLVLFPWSLHLLSSPAAFLSEAGLSTPSLTTHGLSATALLALSPGGPGVPPVWVTAGFAFALLGLFLPVRRTRLVIAGWTVAIVGLLAAVILSRVTVTPPAGGQPAAGWPGVATALAALGLLFASAPVAQWFASIIQNGSGTLPSAPSAPARGYTSRRILAAAALVGAAVTPLLVAAYWVKDGVHGPVHNVSAQILPAFVSASSTSGAQYRTLILRPHGTELDYQVVRQGDPSLGQPELGASATAGAALSRLVAALGTPDGADAGDPGLVLGSFGIRWVLLPSPVDPVLASRLDTALGLAAQNKGPAYDLWQVAGPVGRVRVVAPSGATTVLKSGTVDLSGATAPASGGTLILAEPYGGWTATLNGHALNPVATPVNGWAQGFVLPAGGGQLSIARNNLARPVSLILELVATLAVIVLALPGKRADPAEEAEALTALREVRGSKQTDAGQPQAGVGHRALSRVERLRLSRKFRTGRATADNAPESPALGNQLPASAVPATEAAPDAEFAEWGRDEATTTVSLAGRGQGRRRGDVDVDGGDAGNGGGTGGSPSAPWDMAGDWGSQTAAPTRRTSQDDQARNAGRRSFGSQPAMPEPAAAESARWGTESLDLSGSAPSAGPQNDEDWLNALLRDAGMQRRTSAPESPPWGTDTLNLPATPPADTARRDAADRRPAMPASSLPDPSGWAAAPQDPPAPASEQPRDPAPRNTSGWKGALGRLTGQQPAVPETSPVPSHQEPSRQDSPPLGTPAPDPAATEERPPWEFEPNRAPWDSGPQPRVTPPEAQPAPAEGPKSAWGTEAKSAWGTGALPAVRPGPQSASRTGSQPSSGRTSDRPAGRTGTQPTFTPTGPQPTFTPTGPQPTFTPTGSQPTFTTSSGQSDGGSGPQPVRRAPWESGDWGKASDRNGSGGDREASPAPSDTGDRDQATGRNDATATAPPARADKPERHSHRGGKHGKPRRGRGSGGRSGGDGDS